MLTLWDLIEPRTPATTKRGRRPAPTEPATPTPRAQRQPSAAERYHTLERSMLATYGIRVRKWRSTTSGVAWQVFYRDGTTSRLIESPRPRGPVSAAVFLHEVGHHAIGFNTYKPRCLEEYHAWRFALEQMPLHQIEITPRVRKRVRDSLRYALDKAIRRGLRNIPAEVLDCIAEQDSWLAQADSIGTSKSASMNDAGSNGCTSSGVSPTPTNFTGNPS